MKTRTMFVVVLALVLGGCTGTRNTETKVSVEMYVEVITKVKKNLTDSIRPALEKSLNDVGKEGVKPYIAPYKKAKLDLLDDTVLLLDDTLKGAKAGEKPAEDKKADKKDKKAKKEGDK